jgi:muramidase (phage lysozyme)
MTATSEPQESGARAEGAGVLLDRIARGEAPDRPLSYDTTFGYGAFADPDVAPSRMTLDEIGRLQAEMLRRQRGRRLRSSAVGRYQFNRAELARLRRKLGLSGGEVFTPALQDALAREILDEKGYGDFLTGALDARRFQARLAGKWASVADPRTGRSRYGQRVGTTTEEIQAALSAAKAQARA